MPRVGSGGNQPRDLRKPQLVMASSFGRGTVVRLLVLTSGMLVLILSYSSSSNRLFWPLSKKQVKPSPRRQ